MDIDADVPRPDDHPDVIRLARFMQRSDAAEFGVKIDGKLHPTWDDLGIMGRAEYLKDSRKMIRAVQVLGWEKP